MNKNNEKLPLVAIIAILVGVSALGYFLFRTSPQNPINSVKTTAKATQKDDMSSHHAGGTTSVNSELLNSLVGKPIPDIQLRDKEGKVYTAADFKGKNTVLFFNEGLMCYPGCWNQIAAFGSDERFNSSEVQAISVVVDSANDWQKAIEKMPKLAKANTMFDAGASASRQLGMLTMASSMHRGSLPGHTYVLIDKDGIVRFVFDDPNMAIANDSLFNKIQELNK